METATWQPLGTHQVRVEEDLLFIQIHGVFDTSDMQALFVIGAQQLARYGYYISVVDARLATTMTADARRRNAQWRRDNPESLGCSVVYGANWIARTIITMISRATAMWTRLPVNTHIVSDEAAALECAAQQRQMLRAELMLRRPR